MRQRMRFYAVGLLVLVLAACISSAQEVPPVQPAADVDLPRYMGRWYVIAHIPDPAEAGKVGVYTEYRLREDGRIDHLNYARHGSFDKGAELTERVARVVGPASGAHWKVRSSWLFSDDYLILYVSDDYQYALAGHPSRNHAWIFAREPDLPEWTYAGLLARLAAYRFDVSRMRKVPQTPEQIGQRGFK